MTTRDVVAGRLPWDAADPYSFYEQRRREGNVVWDDDTGAWLILGYHSAQQILGEPGWTSNPLANPNAPRAVRAVFTRTFITGLTAGVEAIASETIDHTPPGGVRLHDRHRAAASGCAHARVLTPWSG